MLVVGVNRGTEKPLLRLWLPVSRAGKEARFGCRSFLAAQSKCHKRHWPFATLPMEHGGGGERAGDILGGKRVSASLANLDPVQCTGSRQPPKKAVKKDWRHQPPPLNLTPKIAEQLFLKTVAVTISP